MKATFYLHEDNFVCPPDLDKHIYVNRIGKLMMDLSNIIEDKVEENVLAISDGIFKVPVYADDMIYDLIDSEFPIEQQKYLYQILYNNDFIRAFAVQDIEPKTYYSPDEKECHSLIVLNSEQEGVGEGTEPEVDDGEEVGEESEEESLEDIIEVAASRKPYMTFDKYEIVYDHGSWLMVRRQILGNHPGQPERFIERSRHYFDKLEFGLDCVYTLEDHLNYVPRKIVYYLSCMNDKLYEFWKTHSNQDSPKIYCAEFAGKYNMDRAGSPQSGKKEKAEDYTFRFWDGSANKEFSLKCGPHFKITHVDSNRIKDGEQKFHSRIYFTIHNNKVHVGSIGRHA